MNSLLRTALCVALLGGTTLPVAAQDAPKAAGPVDLHIVYLSRENDAAYQPVRAENGV